MPLQRGEVLGYDFNRMVVDFTMLLLDDKSDHCERAKCKYIIEQPRELGLLGR